MTSLSKVRKGFISMVMFRNLNLDSLFYFLIGELVNRRGRTGQKLSEELTGADRRVFFNLIIS